MPRRYIPGSDTQFDLWLAHFVAVAGAKAAQCGLAPADVAALVDVQQAWRSAFDEHRAQRTGAVAACATKTAARRRALDLVRPMVQRIHLAEGMDDALRGELQITQRDTPHTALGAPAVAPQVRLDFGHRGRMLVHVGPRPGDESQNGLPDGVAGVVVQYAPGLSPPDDGRAWRWLPTVTASPLVHVVESDVPESLCYRAAYITRRRVLGPWSAIIKATVTP